MRRQAAALIALSAALAASGAARAQPLDLRLSDRAQTSAAPLAVGPRAPGPTPDLANPLDPLDPTAVRPGAMQSAVFARTALDHRFTRREDVTGSVGFLCGLKPGHNDQGGAAAYGVDPHGRFVGAKLSIAFR